MFIKKKKGRHARQPGEEAPAISGGLSQNGQGVAVDSAASASAGAAVEQTEELPLEDGSFPPKDGVAADADSLADADDLADAEESQPCSAEEDAEDSSSADDAQAAEIESDSDYPDDDCSGPLNESADEVENDGTESVDDSASGYQVPVMAAPPISVQEAIGSTSEIAVPSQTTQYEAVAPGNGGQAFSMETPKEKRNVGKIVGITCGIIVAVLLVAYIAGVFFFKGHMFPRTEVGDSDISLMSTAEVEAHLNTKTANYELDVTGYGYALKLPGTNIGFAFDSSAVAQSMHDRQNAFAWPAEFFKDHDYTESVVATYDEAIVKKIVDDTVEAHNSSATDPKDAHIGYDAKENRVIVMAEEYGTKLDANAVNAAVKTAICSATRNLELKQDQLKQPAIKKDNPKLIKAAEGCNSLTTANMTFTVNGQEAFKVGLSCIDQWVDIAENGTVTLNNDKINAWISQTAADYTSAGNTRTYTRVDGKEITVTGGVYGWVVDADAFREAVLAGLKANSTATQEMPFTQMANAFNGAGKQDWGSRYIDVDLSEQHAYMYDDAGELIWDSDIVSGNVNISGRETPEGVYVINTMGTNVTLYTYEAGKEEPEKTLVYYWMPFVDNSIGLHDAWWQPGFGGTRYRDGYGSHGCVNLPSGAAADLYSIAQVGDVVVTHW